jgi:glycosyltransferase involved in cell wall biosynthesis
LFFLLPSSFFLLPSSFRRRDMLAAVRLAWFSPWPPQRSGIAGRSAELVPRLASLGYAIDVFVDERYLPAVGPADAGPPRAGEIRPQSAHDFVWRAARGQYDLGVYQIGNSRLHEYMWPYLLRWPGLSVLHDARLHHVRAAGLLTTKQADTYRAEFAWSHPDVSIDAAELAVQGFDGTYYYQWPMLRAVVETARLVATHSRGVADDLRDAWPERPIEYVALGEGRPTPVADRRLEARRAELGMSGEHVAFGVFGALTADKRVPEVLRAFATTVARTPTARLVLAGTPTPAVDVRALARSLGVALETVLVDTPDDESFDEIIAAVDVGIHLRWPTALETSGPWVRALAAARPTIVTDLAHQTHVPALDPRTWDLHAPALRSLGEGGPALRSLGEGGPAPRSLGEGGPAPRSLGEGGPVTIAVSLDDEEHSLRIAMHRLATDASLRASLGRAARRYWEAEHTLDRMVADYERVIARAAALPAPEAALPPALRPGFWRDVVDGIGDFAPGVVVE